MIEVKLVLDDFDPEGLLALGAPKDEYLSEAREFAARIRHGETMTSDVVLHVWRKWFGQDCRLARNGLADALARCLGELRA